MKVINFLNSDYKFSMQMTSEYLNLLKIMAHKKTIENLGIKNVYAKLVPKVWTDEQKERCVKMSLKLSD